ncbi:hypothetical protein BLNAU_21712 [Blattamonas nauphoetae]|uniref:Uncharacterized protein n=1 Tax=Blattamonas nauphoetae TaxID=2049346 RepID=A0ABQ9WV88_9EUKA|nr:hypothetical protein BLNAU_21712 [Blattamonas nauphoetae]
MVEELCTFKGCNVPTGNGGAIFCYKINVGISIDHDASLRMNHPCRLTISECVFIESEAVQYGGAIGLPQLGSSDKWRSHLKLPLPEVQTNQCNIWKWRRVMFYSHNHLTALTAEVKGTAADVEVALNKEVFGTLLVVVSNTLSDYSIVAAFLPGHVITFSTSPIFESPTIPPSLISAVCSLDASHTKVSVDFEGRAFEDGEYEVALHDDSWFVVELKTDPDGKSTGTKDLGLIGSESVWFERGTWIVKEVKSVTDSTMLIDIAHPVSFTIPTVARLSKIEVSELDGSTKGTLSFSTQETLTRVVTTTSSGEIGVLDEVLSIDFRSGSVGVQMPVEPVRLTKIEVDDETETTIRLLVTGSGLVPKETYTVEVCCLWCDISDIVHTSLQLRFNISAFGQTYTVTKIDNGTDDGIHVLNSQGILLSIVLTGEHLPSDLAFELTLNDTITIPVSFTSSTKGKSEVVMLGLDGGLDFGSTYLITALCTGGLKIIADGISISTPPKPSELTISVCSDDAGDSSMIRTVTMKELGSGGIVQKGGELTISSGIFSDNGLTNSSFPSARQNIHCEGEGKLTIDSLEGRWNRGTAISLD